MIGISAGNGYPIPLEYRYPLFKKAGVDSMILGWDNSEMATRVDRVWLAKAFDLKIEHAHASFANMNALWLSGSDGNRTCNRLLHEIDDCAEFGIKTLVLHLTNGSTPPPVSASGMERVQHLVRLAESDGVKLAFENVRVPQHTQAVLDHFDSPAIGLCYDTGHEHFFTPDTDWLNLYSDRVFALHLHDNDGTADDHRIPFTGTIDWDKKLAAIAASGYTGSITVEIDFRGDAVHEPDALNAHLKVAFESGRRIEEQIRKHRTK